MKDQDRSSEREIDGLDEGGRDEDAKAAPAQEDPAEPRFVDWPKES